ncbi:TPA: multidrug ABC transporter ATP-binding protein, partial [Escherichia coli]|nr:multidrug ABC transporter ATP-binding protein [Escherichia coli]
FINQLANKVFDLNHEGGQMYLGDYQYYIEKTEEAAAIKAQEELNNSSPKTKDNNDTTISSSSYSTQKQQKSQQRKIERQIEQCEAKIEEFETHISYI